MATRRSRRQMSLAAKAKDKGKEVATTLSSDEVEEVSPANSSSTGTPQVQQKATTPTAKRFLQSTGSAKKRIKLGSSTDLPASSIPPVSSQVPETPQPPIEWFRNLELYGKWMDWFSNKPIGYCDQVDIKMFDEMSLTCLEHFKSSTCFKLLNTGTVSYPRLTRLFYLNLTTTHSPDGAILESLVAGVKITVTADLLVRLFDLDPICLTEHYPPKATCVEQARVRFLLPTHVKTRQLTHTCLQLEPKIIFLLIVRCIVPKEHSKELLTDKLLEILFLILSGFQLDTPSLIAEHMLRAVASSRNTSLPYSNLLPIIFKEFNVPLDNEETMHTGPSLINEKSLQKLDIAKTGEGKWKFIKDLTSEELKGLPDLKLKASHAPSSSTAQYQLAERVQTLEVDLLETREHMNDMALRYNVLAERFTQWTERFKIYEEFLTKQQEETKDTAEMKDINKEEDQKIESPLASLAKVAAVLSDSSLHNTEQDVVTRQQADNEAQDDVQQQAIEEVEAADEVMAAEEQAAQEQTTEDPPAGQDVADSEKDVAVQDDGQATNVQVADISVADPSLPSSNPI